MARNPERNLLVGTWRPELIPVALALAAGLAAGTAAAEDVREKALLAILDADWTRAAGLWAQVDGQRARDYLQQARAELQFQQTQPLLNEAFAAQQREDWAAADTAYLKALAVSPYLKAAHQGRKQVELYIEAHRRLDALKLPDGLYDKVIRARAKEWLAYVREKKLNDRKIAKARTDLAAALKLAQVPVSLVLTSDNQSDIEIFGVGKLGRLERQTMQLVPGDYIVVASRPGYRDARATLKVRPGKPVALDIRCTESIQ